MKKINNRLSIIFFLVLFLPLISNAQKHKKAPVKKKNTCTTFVYNLSTDKMSKRDICLNIELTDHIDMNEYRIGKSWDKQYDSFKFTIKIFDFDKVKESSLNASFHVFEETSEIIQYHCSVESAEIKAIIYDKTRSSWEILVLQNDEYKMLSSYSGYRFSNAFNIKTKSSDDKGY
jgi:hypothetical protein